MPNKYITKRIFIYAGLILFVSMFFISSSQLIAHFVEQKIASMSEINELAENSKNITNEINRYKEILKVSGFEESDVLTIKNLDDNINISNEGVKILLEKINSYEESLTFTKNRFISMSNAMNEKIESISIQQQQTGDSFRGLEKSIDRITSLETDNLKLDAIVAHQKNLLQEILVVSDEGKSLKLTKNIKRQIVDAVEGNPQIQIGGPDENPLPNK